MSGDGAAQPGPAAQPADPAAQPADPAAQPADRASTSPPAAAATPNASRERRVVRPRPEQLDAREPGAAHAAPDHGADAALAAAPGEGWLTEAQARRLWAAGARARPEGTVVEIGSFRGRSTVVLALAAGSVVAIDPHAGSDRGPQEIAADAARGDADHETFLSNLAAAGVAGRVRHVRKFSSDAHDDVPGPLALLYVDGAHRFGPARADLAGWGGRVVPGGTMLVHDSFSSIGVTLALLATCAGSRDWRYVGRSGSLAEYERRTSSAGRARDIARHLAELPYFARNVAIKILVVAGRRRWAERIGLDQAAPWPY